MIRESAFDKKKQPVNRLSVWWKDEKIRGSQARKEKEARVKI